MKALYTFVLLASCIGARALPLASNDPTIARQAISYYVEKGATVLPELREYAKSDDPRLRSRAKEAIGGITGHWGSDVDLIWKRKMAEAKGQGKPIMMLHLFGNLDEEFC